MNCKRRCGPHLHCTPSRAGKPTWKLALWNVNRSFQHSVKSRFFVRIKSDVLVLVTERNVAGYLTVSCATLSFVHVCWGNSWGFSGRIFFVLNVGDFREKFSAHCVAVQVEHKLRTLQTTHTNLCSHLRLIIRTWNVCHQSQTEWNTRFIHSMNMYPWVWQLFRYLKKTNVISALRSTLKFRHWPIHHPTWEAEVSFDYVKKKTSFVNVSECFVITHLRRGGVKGDTFP